MLPESETLERAALEDLQRSVPRDQAAALGISGLAIGSAFVSIAAKLPSTAIVINRALGLGLSQPGTPDDVRQIVETYRRREVPQYFVQLHPQALPSELPRWLEEQGLVESRAWQKFSRGTQAVQERPTDLVIREVGPEHGEDFGRIVCAGFDLGDEAVPWLATLPGRERWRVFMSFDRDEPAGAGALFVHQGLAWMDFAATLPQFRSRGSQGAILASRMQLAVALGCQRMFTCTGEDVPGDPQHSYKNILKAGFGKDYLRKNYAPARDE